MAAETAAPEVEERLRGVTSGQGRCAASSSNTSSSISSIPAPQRNRGHEQLRFRPYVRPWWAVPLGELGR